MSVRPDVLRPTRIAFRLGAPLLVVLLGLSLGGLGAAPAAAQHSHPHSHAEGRVIAFPDVPGYHTIKADLHIHTVFSDGSVWPTIRVEEALRDGLDAVAMTDHLEVQPHAEDIPHPDRNRSFEIAREAAAGHDLIVINGSEITRRMPPGHANAVFVEDANRLLNEDAMAVFREAERQGAFTFWNHPMWTAQKPDGIPSLTPMHRTLIAEGLLDGIEVVNQHTYSEEALRIALEHDLTILGTSDIHGLIDWDYHVHEGGHRPITMAFASERTAEALRDALQAGRTAVWYDNTLIGREAHVTPLLEASLQIEGATYQPDTAVLEVRIRNRSDARFVLQRRHDMAHHTRTGLVTIEPHATTTLQVKPGERVGRLTLAFEVLNAVTAPDEHPVLRFEVTPTNAE